MTQGLTLFKALLNHQFYEENKHRIVDDLFPRQIHSLLATLNTAHQQYGKDISVDELWDLHQANNPTITSASKLEYTTVLANVKAQEECNLEVYKDVLKKVWKQELARRAADKLLGISEEDTTVSLEDIKSILNDIETENYIDSKTDYITTDVSELLGEISANYRWKVNINHLGNAIGNIGGGTFGIIAAVPDCGKTCCIVNIVFGDGGFLKQGAKVHVIGNEEPAQRTMLRGINCYTGITTAELHTNPDNVAKAQAAFNEIKGNIFIQNSVDMTLDKLDRYCKDKQPDILIIDQIDKLKVHGYGNGNDVAKLAYIYAACREIAKRRNVAIIGVCQAGDGAQGKLYYGYDDLYGSKTAKAGEADYILCIGMQTPEAGKSDNGYRVINIAKNKSPGGNKVPVACQFNLELSRVIA